MTVEPGSTDASVDERGVLLTAEGRQRARQQLADADARWTDAERRERAAAALRRLRGQAA
ncbi:hypothetical protein ACFFX1_11060 [Dactylosporangium sucinum]|uniref:Uncharacterized protein n=1 Tax=Dactylosporangium sucinum TaxID=1424081 RepID=A0A917WR29_9ACTN|nr:hypothetical protein [Dactylosporangium sucinum]GGM22562.1 hypothetical protein GCM10007977_024650 [Dactylosporangium sucinum]